MGVSGPFPLWWMASAKHIEICVVVTLHTESHAVIYRLPPLPPTSSIRWFDDLMDFDWKWGFGLEMGGGLMHPNSVFGLVQPCRGLFFQKKHVLRQKKMNFQDF